MHLSSVNSTHNWQKSRESYGFANPWGVSLLLPTLIYWHPFFELQLSSIDLFFYEIRIFKPTSGRSRRYFGSKLIWQRGYVHCYSQRKGNEEQNRPGWTYGKPLRVNLFVDWLCGSSCRVPIFQVRRLNLNPRSTQKEKFINLFVQPTFSPATDY
jgi:hypothetical protein